MSRAGLELRIHWGPGLPGVSSARRRRSVRINAALFHERWYSLADIRQEFAAMIRKREPGKFQHVADVKGTGAYGIATVISFDATLSTPLESTLLTT
jgi:hypothetical protein